MLPWSYSSADSREYLVPVKNHHFSSKMMGIDEIDQRVSFKLKFQKKIFDSLRSQSFTKYQKKKQFLRSNQHLTIFLYSFLKKFYSALKKIFWFLHEITMMRRNHVILFSSSTNSLDLSKKNTATATESWVVFRDVILFGCLSIFKINHRVIIIKHDMREEKCKRLFIIISLTDTTRQTTVKEKKTEKLWKYVKKGSTQRGDQRKNIFKTQKNIYKYWEKIVSRSKSSSQTISFRLRCSHHPFKMKTHSRHIYTHWYS